MMYPGSNMAESLALFNAWLDAFPVPVGWVKTNPIGTITPWYYPPGQITAPGCDNWRVRQLLPTGGSIPCAGECASSTKYSTLFSYEHILPSERYYNTLAERTAAATAKGEELETAFDAWWASGDAPSIKWTKGTCEYELTPNLDGIIGAVWTGLNYRSCVNYIPSNPPGFRYVLCQTHIQYISNLSTLHLRAHWKVRCVNEPCTMADYNWPLTLPCSCVAEYDKPGLTAKPTCGLYLISTRREWAGDKCLFIAQYGGAIEAGEVVCEPESTLPDCICCEEP